VRVSISPPQRSDHDEETQIVGTQRSAPGGGRKRSVKTAAIGIASLLLLLLVIGVVPRIKRRGELSAAAREQASALPTVTVASPRQATTGGELTLPATTQAIQETVIFARTQGYVKKWYVGMGMQVREGQLLAEIETPETDQQLREARQQASEAEQTIAQSQSELGEAQASLEQAEAAVKQARTGLELARVNLDRSKTLVAHGVVSRQDTDDKQAAYDARAADVEAAQATVRAKQALVKAQQSSINSRQSNFNARQANSQRIVELQSFGRIVAPFSGTITARNVEVGTLINENGALSNGNGLFRIARLDIIRIFINVPQTYIATIDKGMLVDVEVKELPQRLFKGAVIGTSHSIEPATRTFMAEARVQNPEKQLVSGMYANVKFALPASDQHLMIPASALVVNPEGTQAMLLRPDQTVHVQKIEIGRDFGKEIEVLSGLKGDELIITNPTDALREGTRVKRSMAGEGVVN
jgi:multidrug efflux system membrane fusion protein